MTCKMAIFRPQVCSFLSQKRSETVVITSREEEEVNITKIVLLGERNSGTNYIQNVLKAAFYPRYAACKHPEAPFSGRYHPPPQALIPVFDHKHMMRHGLLQENELQEIRDLKEVLWLLVVRNPCDWVDGMWRKPWFLCPPHKDPSMCPLLNLDKSLLQRNPQFLVNETRETFLVLPWIDAAEALVHPEDPNQYTYQDVFALRRHKLQLMKQVMDTLGHTSNRFAIHHLHNVEAGPHQFLQTLSQNHELAVNLRYRPQKPSQKAHPIKCLSDREWKILEAKMHWELEALFGFSKSDCHRCSSTANNAY